MARGRQEVPPDPGSDPRIGPVRHIVGGRQQFAMQRRIAYRDPDLGEPLVHWVTGTLLSDLTSALACGDSEQPTPQRSVER